MLAREIERLGAKLHRFERGFLVQECKRVGAFAPREGGAGTDEHGDSGMTESEVLQIAPLERDDGVSLVTRSDWP